MNAMNCNAYKQKIFLYAELTDEERVDLLIHLESCVKCTATFKAAQKISEITGALASEVPTPFHAAKLTHSIMTKIAEPERGEGRLYRFFKYHFLRAAMTSFSVVLVIFFAIELMRAPSSEIQQVRSVVAHEVVLDFNAFKAMAAKKRAKGLAGSCASPFRSYQSYVACAKEKLK